MHIMHNVILHQSLNIRLCTLKSLMLLTVSHPLTFTDILKVEIILQVEMLITDNGMLQSLNSK